MTGYAALIAEATGVTDPADLREIEDVMRHDVFHSTLDWQSRDVFIAGAVEAWLYVQELRAEGGVDDGGESRLFNSADSDVRFGSTEDE
jgi:hypothetical protein